MVSINRQIAAKARWAKVDPKVRESIARHAAVSYWSKRTTEEKHNRAMKMVEARKKKYEIS